MINQGTFENAYFVRLSETQNDTSDFMFCAIFVLATHAHAERSIDPIMGLMRLDQQNLRPFLMAILVQLTPQDGCRCLLQGVFAQFAWQRR